MPSNSLNPLRDILLDEGATLMAYGVEPPEPGMVQRAAPAGGEGADPSASNDVPLLAAAFGPIELEYASLRKDCVIIDRPDRAVIEVSGFDAREFLGRMLTNDVAALKPGESCNSFWLNRKGRIDADLRITRWPADGDEGDVFFMDVEVGSVETTIRTLGAYVITEEVRFTIRTRDAQLSDIAHRNDNPNWTLHRLSLQGPKAADLLFGVTGPEFDERVLALEPGRAIISPIGHWPARVERHDSAGVPGYELIVRRDDAPDVYRTLLHHGRPEFMSGEFASPDDRGAAVAAAHRSPPEARFATPASIRLRPCGWFAYNIARIEAGTPLFKIDFGPDNLPAETGVIDDRVNFKKGCYLGQEIVARMHARGHPKQRLVALRFDDDLPLGPDGLPPLPVQGDRVLAIPADADNPPISSTQSEPEAGARASSPPQSEPEAEARGSSRLQSKPEAEARDPSGAAGAPGDPACLPNAASMPHDEGDRGSVTPPHAAPKPLGSITSSTFSPMLGRIPIAFAMLAWSHVAPGTRVRVETDSGPIDATVQNSLRFVP